MTDEENAYGSLFLPRLLPAEFIQHVGTYIQTCSHLEVAGCMLIACLEHGDVEGDAWFQKYCECRKMLGTAQLISRIRQCAPLAKKSGFGSELEKLANWLDMYKNNRHMAVHGAFFGRPDGTLRIDFVHNIGTRKEPRYEREAREITRKSVLEIIVDADDLLRTVHGMLEAIEGGLSTRCLKRVVPHVFDRQRGGW